MRTFLFPYLSHCPLQASKPTEPLSKDEPKATPPTGPEKPSHTYEWLMLTETEMIPVYGVGGRGKSQKKQGKPEAYKVGKTRPRYLGTYHPVHTQNPLYLCMCPNCQEVVPYNKAMLRANEPCPSCMVNPRSTQKGRPVGSVSPEKAQVWERAGWYSCGLVMRRSLSVSDFLAECEIAGLEIDDDMAITVCPHIARNGFSTVFYARTARQYKSAPDEPIENRVSPTTLAAQEEARAGMRDIEVEDDFDENIPF